eukprot:2241738-Prymnesium_polylepis.1
MQIGMVRCEAVSSATRALWCTLARGRRLYYIACRAADSTHSVPCRFVSASLRPVSVRVRVPG